MNRPAIIFIITSLISSCSQPNFTSVNNTLPSSSNTIKVETNKTIAAENKVNTQINNESKTALEKDANLGVKLDGTIASTIAQATSTPQPTTYISASPSAYKGYDSSTNIQVVNPNVRETLAPGIPTPPTATSSNPIDFRDKPFGYYSDPNYGRVEAYSRQEEIPIGMRSGVISLIFKDEYKIRLKSHVDKQLNINSGNYIFSSLDTNVRSEKESDLKLLHEILNNYKISKLGTSLGNIGTEQEQEADEKKISEAYNYDYANSYSSYNFNVNDDDIEKLIKSLRKLSIVRESNYLNPIGFVGLD